MPARSCPRRSALCQRSAPPFPFVLSRKVKLMRSLSLLVALAATAAATYAQSTCTGPGPAGVLATQNPFSGNSLYGHPNYPNPPGPTYTGFNFLFDLTLNVPVTINGIDIDLYDAGGLVNL